MLTKFLSLSCVLFSLISYAQEKETLANKINQIIVQQYELTKRLNIAIQVNELNTGKEIFSLNSAKYMIPASTTKLLTAYAALNFLGPDFSYKTEISFDKNKISKAGILNGDLIIKFGGDPSLTLDEFNSLLLKLKQYKIHKINGNIIIDDQVFDQYYQANGWSWDDAKFCFAAPTSAIVVEKNCFYLDLIAGDRANTPTKLSGFSVAKISNQIISANDPSCSPELKARSDNSYNLTGCLNLNSPVIPLKIAYQDPRLMLIDLIRANKLAFKGKILFESAALFNTVIEHKSAALSELVKYMMKNSDNLYADNFLKTIGAKYYNAQGTFANGQKALLEIIKNNEIIIFDGSGGSRYNLVSPEQFIDLFLLAKGNSTLWPYFYDSLPISNTDGTLQNRLPTLKGRIRAKTGGMKAVTNLVGLIENENKNTLIFAIMINGSSNQQSVQEFLDKILETIADNS